MVVEVDSLRMQGNFDPVLSLIPGIQGQNRSAGSYLPMQVHFSPVVASSQTCSVPITQISANPAQQTFIPQQQAISLESLAMQRQSRAHGGLAPRDSVPASIDLLQNPIIRFKLKEELALQQAMSSVPYTSSMLEVIPTPVSQLNSLETAAGLATRSMITQTTMPSIQQSSLISAERFKQHGPLKVHTFGGCQDPAVIKIAASQKDAQLRVAGESKEGADPEEAVAIDRAEKASRRIIVSDTLKATLNIPTNSGEQNPAAVDLAQEVDLRKGQTDSEEKSKAASQDVDQVKLLERRGRKRKSRGKSTFLDNLWDLAGQGPRASKSPKTPTETVAEEPQTEAAQASQGSEQSIADTVEVQDGSCHISGEVQRLHTRNRWLTRVLSELDIQIKDLRRENSSLKNENVELKSLVKSQSVKDQQ